jgi:hypothetical protein
MMPSYCLLYLTTINVNVYVSIHTDRHNYEIVFMFALYTAFESKCKMCIQTSF